jgi:hypothetical protein
MNRFFDYRELQVKKEEDEEFSNKWESKYLNFHFEKVASLQEDLTRLPTPGEIFFLLSEGSFNAFTFIPLIAKRFPVKELFASTYSISRRVVEAVIEMHDKGMIEQVTLLVSESMIKRNPVTIDNLMAMAKDRPNVNVLYAWVHAKVCLLRTHEFHYVIEGSGNWAENAQYEQYLLANDKGLYDFRMNLFTTSKLKKYP